jgi:two-component system sensor histidine kinase KdpD
MNETRPDPDTLLERVRAEEARVRRGYLKIFFGYAAGVGKTYSMLEAARRASAAGRDVVVGYVEPHGRRETEVLLEGLEAIPSRQVEYRGVSLWEFDLDVALTRKPELILVDELAHTNAEGCRHAKRWQDVEELLEAGVNVWTTLNVQHIDSLNDVIGRITGVTVRETVPDGIFDRADDLELVDLTPEELLERLKAGRVYIPDQAERALGGFFQKSNLVALREFSLRQAARRVHTDVESARRQRSITEPWPTAERLLVCVGPGRSTDRLIRTAKRMAAGLDAPWLAVSVERVGRATDAAVKERVRDGHTLGRGGGGHPAGVRPDPERDQDPHREDRRAPLEATAVRHGRG